VRRLRASRRRLGLAACGCRTAAPPRPPCSGGSRTRSRNGATPGTRPSPASRPTPRRDRRRRGARGRPVSRGGAQAPSGHLVIRPAGGAGFVGSDLHGGSDRRSHPRTPTDAPERPTSERRTRGIP
jgi:hypothetical protein